MKHITLVAERVHRVVLGFRRPQSFSAGQYLKLWLNPSLHRSYSIASSTRSVSDLEVFVGHQNDESTALALLRNMKNIRETQVTLPFGEACYRKSDAQQILLIAGGTGYGYIRSILLEAIDQAPSAKINLLWGVRGEESLFDIGTLRVLAEQNSRFSYQLWVENGKNTASAMCGDIVQAIMSQTMPTAVTNTDTYIGGGGMMIAAVRKALNAKGFNPVRIFSD